VRKRERERGSGRRSGKGNESGRKIMGTGGESERERKWQCGEWVHVACHGGRCEVWSTQRVGVSRKKDNRGM
jgi:hypothetical protein